MLGSARVVGFIPTRNFALARAFYEGQLGLLVESTDEFAIVLRAGAISIRLVVVRDFSPFPFTLMGWDVARIQETVTQMKSRGIVFETFEGLKQNALGIWEAPGGAQVAWFKDADGNLLSVSEKAPG